MVLEDFEVDLAGARQLVVRNVLLEVGQRLAGRLRIQPLRFLSENVFQQMIVAMIPKQCGLQRLTSGLGVEIALEERLEPGVLTGQFFLRGGQGLDHAKDSENGEMCGTWTDLERIYGVTDGSCMR